jgi:L-threonylcarbamoyladenylate synthase
VTAVWPVDPANPDPATIQRAAARLRAGRLVAFPTETVYGLGAAARDEFAVKAIFAAKGRPATNPVIVHVADPADGLKVASAWPDAAARLAAAFWPGPLTLVLPKRDDLPAVVTAGGPTVAVRCPDHPVARALLRAVGAPLAAPSANRSTELSPTRAEHVLRGLDGRIDAILDAGPCRAGLESTVVDLTDGVRVLRPGPVSAAMVEAVVGPVAYGAVDDGIAKSPGLMAKHYSPRTPALLANDRADAERLAGANGSVVELGDDPAVAAAHLYATLHALDDGRYDRIAIVRPPDTPAWAAVHDRLRRAATPG